MNAPTALVSRPSSPVAPPPAASPPEEEVGLAALLDLLAADESPARSSLRADGVRLRAWARQWVRRATAWGAGPGGTWRAW